jgi:hypothetical protein
MALASKVVLGFGPLRDPWPYFCSFQTSRVLKWGLFFDENRGLTNIGHSHSTGEWHCWISLSLTHSTHPVLSLEKLVKKFRRFIYLLHNSPTLNPVLSQINWAHNLTHKFFKIHINAIILNEPSLLKFCFAFRIDKYYDRVHKSLPLDPILTQMNPVHIL